MNNNTCTIVKKLRVLGKHIFTCHGKLNYKLVLFNTYMLPCYPTIVSLLFLLISLFAVLCCATCYLNFHHHATSSHPLIESQVRCIFLCCAVGFVCCVVFIVLATQSNNCTLSSRWLHSNGRNWKN